MHRLPSPVSRFLSSTTDRIRILLTNDDGIEAEGLSRVLVALRRGNADVRVSAPAEQQSAQSHSLTLHEPLIAHRHQLRGRLRNVEAWRVHGTPADCVKVALTAQLFDDAWRPDLVVSGINSGSNTGANIHYSGTIAAAREAAIHCVPAVALSLQHSRERLLNYAHCTENAAHLVLSYAGFLRDAPPSTAELLARIHLNANFPSVAQPRGWRLTKQGMTTWLDHYRLIESTLAEKRFQLGVALKLNDPEDGDTAALLDDWISVTALTINPHQDVNKALDALAPFLRDQLNIQ